MKTTGTIFEQEGKTQISHPLKQSYEGAARIMLQTAVSGID